MSNWKWISRQVLLLLHDESLAEHGGASGLRDEGLLELALAWPLNLSLETPDVSSLAAAYGVGLFLAINGYRLQATQVDATLTILSVAAGDIEEAAFADWIRSHSQPR